MFANPPPSRAFVYPLRTSVWQGLDAGVLDLLLGKHAERSAPRLQRLIYVSCGFEALERDTRMLVDSSLWRIKSTEGFVLFPGSDHVETVIVFDKVEKKQQLDVEDVM